MDPISTTITVRNAPLQVVNWFFLYPNQSLFLWLSSQGKQFIIIL